MPPTNRPVSEADAQWRANTQASVDRALQHAKAVYSSLEMLSTGQLSEVITQIVCDEASVRNPSRVAS